MKNAWHLVGLAVAVVMAGCSSPVHRVVAPVTSLAPVATTSTTVPAPTTTVYHATAPQSSADIAASHLVAAWRTGDLAGALTAATPAAVNAVFAQPYPASGAQARGCSDPLAGASSCAYRVKSGLLTISAGAVTGGWIIETATFS